ncbi:MAG: hypothetical protein LBF58_04935 [Deltaproteobacteria bacterium]|jgi:deoxyhypusine synthase|nr:hypothetical protein [Deltaproteobacteria bacterium]
MKPKLPELDFGSVRFSSLKDRPSKVNLTDFAKPLVPGGSFAGFVDGLSDILAAKDIKDAAASLARAAKDGRTVMLAMGGHPIKVGLGPVICQLLRGDLVSSISGNGAIMVHDTEVALTGATSEDVAAGLGKGDFGVTRETGEIIAMAINRAAESREGLGRALGQTLIDLKAPNLSVSVLATAVMAGKPVTVHVAIGNDVYHIHPACDGANLGAATMDDFKTFCRIVATLGQGAFINLGSAVIMPEVFLKALTLTRNMGFAVDGLTTINMDFIKQYRPSVNVVERPTKGSGRGYTLIGHHEIMFPLLMGMAMEKLAAMGET